MSGAAHLRCPSCSSVIVMAEGQPVIGAGAVNVLDIVATQAHVIQEQAAVIATQSDRIEELSRNAPPKG